jgi:hypothetical protein
MDWGRGLEAEELILRLVVSGMSGRRSHACSVAGTNIESLPDKK